MIRSFIYFILLLAFCQNAVGQVNFTKSNLPIIIIKTNGAQIQDEPKIMAEMHIINNGPGLENKITDTPNDYNGKIGIELRGSTSQWFPKKPYGFETWDDIGEDNDIKLLGMPKESDWTLNATYNDKSLIRDGLSYILAGSIMEYAPRVRYNELILNGQYQGIYLLIEKIKRDKNRVDIAKIETTDILGDALTGGYILKFDKETGSNSGQGWYSLYTPYPGAWQNTYFQYEYPKADEISSEQKVYIRDHMIKVENSIAGEDFEDPVNGYRRYMDIQSLMDFIIINEISKNPDAYRLSTYFYKERDSDGGKIKFGPVWDFNLGFGNVDYCTQGNPDGLVINTFNDVCPGDNWVIHFWWNKFLQDELFYNDLKQRWKTLRSNQLTDQRVNFVIDSVATLLSQAQVRNFQQWPILGQYVWPNYFVGTTYIEEVNYLKAWVKSRFKYLDKEWEVKNSNVSDIDLGLYSVGPNPTNSLLSLNFKETIPSDLTITLYDSRGVIFSNMIKTTNNKSIELDIRGLPSGLFLIQINMQGKIYTHKIIKQ